MGLIDNRETFVNIRALASRVFDLSTDLPEQVFRSNIRTFLFLDVDELFTEQFYSSMNNFVAGIPEATWLFFMKYPDPEQFKASVGKYPTFQVDVDHSYEIYWGNVGQRHSSETHYTIFDEGTSKIILFSASGEWGILMDRDFELGIAGFSNMDLVQKFLTAFGDENVFDLNEAIDMFVLPGITTFMGFGGRRALLDKLSENYG